MKTGRSHEPGIREGIAKAISGASGFLVNLAMTVMVSVGCCILMVMAQGPSCGLWLIFPGLFRERARAQYS